eukprot:GHVP01065075.1.p1 GENE.GHVP01065075.1~~GHVP01065075.1.p1  ORF type:complete len:788 (+),score=149.32 GHVP01065075.1:2-2365(+)
MSIQLSEILQNTLSSEKIIREKATETLKEMEKLDMLLYLNSLTSVFTNNNIQEHIRIAAGIAMKNIFRLRRAPVESLIQIKEKLIETLSTDLPRIGSTCSQIIEAIASFEIELDNKTTLLDPLIKGALDDSDDNRRINSFIGLGFIYESNSCEQIVYQTGNVLRAVMNSLEAENPKLRKEALETFYQTIQFIGTNIEQEAGRDYIIQKVFERTSDSSEEIKTLAIQSLKEIFKNFYEYFSDYCEKGFFDQILLLLNTKDPVLAYEIVEFFITILEIEILKVEYGEEIHKIGSRYSRQLTEILLVIACSDDSLDDDVETEWGKETASMFCLSLLCKVIDREIFMSIQDTIHTFIRSKSVSPKWQDRNTSLLAFNAILEGGADSLSNEVGNAIEFFLSRLQDESAQVRDTAAWLIGRVYETVPESKTLDMEVTGNVFKTILSMDYNFQTTNTIWTLMEIIREMKLEPSRDIVTGLMDLIYALLQKSDFALIASVYDLQKTLIEYINNNELDIVQNLLVKTLDDIEGSLRSNLMTVHIAGQLSIIEASVKKLNIIGKHEINIRVLYIIYNILKEQESPQNNYKIDSLLLLSSTIDLMSSDISACFPQIMPALLDLLKEHDDYHLQKNAIGVVGDITRSASSEDFMEYGDRIMEILLRALNSDDVNKTVKPECILCIGDILMCVDANRFSRYINPVMEVFGSACALAKVYSESIEEIEDISLALLEFFHIAIITYNNSDIPLSNQHRDIINSFCVDLSMTDLSKENQRVGKFIHTIKRSLNSFSSEPSLLN